MSIVAACEGFAFGKVRGWAFDKKAKERRLSVSFFVDDQFVGATTGEIHRDDLEAAGFGDGCFGAELEVPSQLLDGESHKVEMVVEGDLKVTCEEAQVFDPMSVSPDFLVEHLDSRGAAGWAYQRVSGEEVKITLSSRQGVIAEGIAEIRRNDVSSPAPGAQRQQHKRIPGANPSR